MAAKKIFNKYVTPKTTLDYSRSIFNYERTHSTNMLTGLIYPVGLIKCMPGDTVPNKFGFVVQSAPLLGPSLDNVYIDIISVWTPNRLVLSNFNEWLGDNDTNTQQMGNISLPKITKLDSDYLQVSAGVYTTNTISKAYYAEHFLAPHIGCRWFGSPGSGGIFYQDFANFGRSDSRYHGGLNVMSSRIYDLNWNRLFRNENIQNPIAFSRQAGTDLALDVVNYQGGLGRLHKANRLKNIFTTAWPFPAIQTVDIGFGADVPVVAGNYTHAATGANLIWSLANGTANTAARDLVIDANGVTHGDGLGTVPSSATVVPANLYADLSALTVNSMYYAIMLQKYYNKATLGRRPVEFYKTFFGISSSQAAFDDPQLLSQKRFKLNISRVVATSNSTDAQSNTQPLGSQGAFSVTSVGGVLFPEFTATEYGELHIYAVIRTQESFSSGIDRHLTDGDLLSTYIPTFDHIGPDYIEMTEFADYYPLNGSSPIVFGYQNAWYNYRFQVNDVVGIMSPGEPLDYFTLSRNYSRGTTPLAINNAFIEQSPFEIDRMLQFPVFYGTPNTAATDADGEYYATDRYQWLIQFALAGDFARTMSKDSEPLSLGRI